MIGPFIFGKPRKSYKEARAHGVDCFSQPNVSIFHLVLLSLGFSFGCIPSG